MLTNPIFAMNTQFLWVAMVTEFWVAQGDIIINKTMVGGQSSRGKPAQHEKVFLESQTELK